MLALVLVNKLIILVLILVKLKSGKVSVAASVNEDSCECQMGHACIVYFSRFLLFVFVCVYFFFLVQLKYNVAQYFNHVPESCRMQKK